jgi:hypothetical protein
MHTPTDATPPDIAEPIIGWRLWRIHRATGLLESLIYLGHVWMPGKPMRAFCTVPDLSAFVDGKRLPPHDAPRMDCDCGIYAFSDMDGLIDYLGEVAKTLRSGSASSENFDPARSLVAGAVYLWGRVVVCSSGYRAEFAYPARIYRFTESPPQLLGYGVPCEPAPPALMAVLGSHG